MEKPARNSSYHFLSRDGVYAVSALKFSLKIWGKELQDDSAANEVTIACVVNPHLEFLKKRVLYIIIKKDLCVFLPLELVSFEGFC